MIVGVATEVNVVENECNIPNVDVELTVWDASINYQVIGSEVVVLEENGTAVNGVFMLVGVDANNDNIGHNPVTEPVLVDTVLWERVRSTNLYNFLEYNVGTTTKNDGDLVLVFEAELVNTLSFFGVKGTKLKIESLPSLDIIYDKTLIKEPTNWYEALTYKLEYQSDITIDVPFTLNQKFRVTISGANTEVGAIVPYKKNRVGCTQYGIKNDNSLLRNPTTDNYGKFTFGGNDFTRSMTATLNIENKDDYVSTAYDFFTNILGVPCVFQATENFKLHNIFGYIVKNPTTFDNISDSTISLSIESFKYKKD